MIIYELAMLTKVMPKTETAEVLRRTASSIFDKGGIIRQISNLGARKTPYKISKHGAVHREANYFVMSFTAPPTSIDSIGRDYNRDVDILNSQIFKQVEPDEKFDCTIEEEMRPPPYRPEVIKMIEQAKSRKEWQDKLKKKFKYNTGLDYYPFQK